MQRLPFFIKTSSEARGNTKERCQNLNKLTGNGIKHKQQN